MAYTINRTDGTLFATVEDGTINTDSSLIMLGKNYAGYGEALNENLFRLLESHANPTPPLTPQLGQVWFDSSEGLLKIWSNEWKDLGASTAGTAGPDAPITGDLWYDTVNSQLNVYDGAKYVLIGPSFSSGTGTTGYIVDTVTDGVLEHVILKVVVSDNVVAIISKDSIFVPTPVIPGFSVIQPGYNLATLVDGGQPLYVGDSTNALLLNGIADTQFIRKDTPNETMLGTLSIDNDAGFTVGDNNEAKISINGGHVTLENQFINRDLILGLNLAGTPTDVILLNSATATAQITYVPATANDIVNMAYVDGEIITALASVAATSQPLDSYVPAVDNTFILDFNGGTVVTSSLTADISLLTLNSVAGQRIERIFTASGADRTVTLNASWRSFGEASPIVIPNGKSLVLSLTSTITNDDTGIYCASVLEN